MIYNAVNDLVCYALRCGLIETDDRVWATNRLMDALKLSDWQQPEAERMTTILRRWLCGSASVLRRRKTLLHSGKYSRCKLYGTLFCVRIRKIPTFSQKIKKQSLCKTEN